MHGAEVLRALLRRVSQFMFGLDLQIKQQPLAGSGYAISAGGSRPVWLIGWAWTLYLLAVGVPGYAQSSRPALRSVGHRAGNIPERPLPLAHSAAHSVVQLAAYSADPQVARQADHEGYEAVPAEIYSQTLAPATSGYETIIESDPTMAAHCDCGVVHDYSGGCLAAPLGCQPFGWLLDWSRGDLWIGTTSFTGAGNFLGTATDAAGQIAGNFGFQEGFNFGTRLPGVLGGELGSQLGMRFTQTQLDGTTAGDDSRTQTFVTGGLFRRVDYGLQAGLVVDYLHDDWVYQVDLLQLRGEASFLFSRCHDFGFRFTDSQQTDDTQAMLRGASTPHALRLAALNTYRFFYRARFGTAATNTAELQAGFSEDSAAILGANLRAPLQNQLGIELNATYLLPADSQAPAYTQEGWNLSLALVWSPGRCFGSDRDYFRPLLDVAHNGNLFTRHVTD